MFERFTDRARRVVVLAQEEARMLNHNYIGTEHILLGLIHEGEGVAAKALESLGIMLESVRQQVEEIIGQGQVPPTGHIPFTPRAKRVLELSLRESRQLGHSYIGTEHVLLGLVVERDGVAAQVLRRLGADEQRVREQVLHELVQTPPVEMAPVAEPPQPLHRADGPTCPRCKTLLRESITFETQPVGERAGDREIEVVVVFCSRCGNALGVVPPMGGEGPAPSEPGASPGPPVSA